MKLEFPVSVSLLAALALAGCESSESAPQGSLPAASAPAQPSGTYTLGYLVTRDYRVELLSGAKGPLFTVMTTDGELVAANLTEETLAMDYPALHTVVGSSVAGRDMTWAGLDE